MRKAALPYVFVIRCGTTVLGHIADLGQFRPFLKEPQESLIFYAMASRAVPTRNGATGKDAMNAGTPNQTYVRAA